MKNIPLYGPVFLIFSIGFILVIISIIANLPLGVISIEIACLAFAFTIISYLINYRINCLNHFDNWLLNLNNKLIEYPQLIQNEKDTDGENIQGLRNIHGGNAWNFMESVFMRGYHDSPHLEGAFKDYVKRYGYLYNRKSFHKRFADHIEKTYKSELNQSEEKKGSPKN